MIPFFDLGPQYRSIREELDAAVLRALASTQYALGPPVDRFEARFAEFCGCGHAIGVNSGASALYLALLAAGVGPGDEVITVPFTFVATVAAIEWTGATPVLVDIDPETYTMAPESVAQAITSRTRVLLPVHLYGQCADMDPLLALARARRLMVIEDAAQAHGAEYQGCRAGSMGTMGCFSFYPAKNLGACGEGGAITTSDPSLAARLRALRDWGQVHRHVHAFKGGNFRMDGIQGAVLGVKLDHLEEWNNARRERAAWYDEGLREAAVTPPRQMSGRSHVYHLYVLACDDRDGLKQELQDRRIMTAIHYPTAVHLQPAYHNLGYGTGAFPVAESAARQVLSLPMFPELPEESIDRVCEAIRDLRHRAF